jgi:small conductance mechanosensitive channel
LGAIVILVIGWLISRGLYNGTRRLCERSARLDRTVTLFLANGARYLVLVFTFSAVLSSFGIATTSFVAVLGALGIAVGPCVAGHAQQSRCRDHAGAVPAVPYRRSDRDR